MKGSEIKGLELGPAGTDTVTGTVEDIVLDWDERRASALLVLSGGPAGTFVVDTDDVETVEGGRIQAARDASPLPLADRQDLTARPSLNRVIGQDVLRQGGEVLGRVVDLEIDTESWTVKSFDVVANVAEALRDGVQEIDASKVRAGAKSLLVVD